MHEQIAEFLPGIREHAGSLYEVMTAVAAMLVLAGLMVRFARASGDPGQAVRAVTSAGIIAIIISVFPEWVDGFRTIAYELVDGMDADPSRAHVRFASLVGGASADGAVGFWDILWGENGGLGNAMVYACLFLLGKLAQVVMFLFFVVQQVLVLIQTALAPAFLAMFLIGGSLGSLAVQFFMRLAAVCLWPLGWAIASVFTNALLDAAAGSGGGPVAGYFQGTGYMMVLSIWILISTIAAPLLIWKLLSSGAGVGGGLLSAVGLAVGQGAIYGMSGGMTAAMAGASRGVTSASAAAGGASGAISGAMGGGGMLVPSAIGLGSVMAGASSGPVDYDARAAELRNRS